MKKYLSLLLTLLIAIAAIAAECVEGDDDKPGRIFDLAFFDVSDQYSYRGQVFKGDTVSEVDTRILAWTAPGDDGFDGLASLYDIRYIKKNDLLKFGVASPAAFFKNHWADARELYGERYPDKGGSVEQLMVPRIHFGDTLWFAIRTYDEVGQRGDVSKVAGPLTVPLLNVPLQLEAGPAPDLAASVSSAGDMNGDGRQDLVLGGPFQGVAAVMMGRGTRGLMKYRKNATGYRVFQTIDRDTPMMALYGDSADRFGEKVAGLGKLNKDKLFDLGVGAPGYDGPAMTDSGAVYVKYGGLSMPGVLSADSVDVIIEGDQDQGLFGIALAPAFDINSDGRAEFLVGAPGAFSAGAVYVFRSAGLASGTAASAIAVIKGEAPGDDFGRAVSSISDVNGDGIPDIAIGAPQNDGAAADGGAVYIFYGGKAGVIDFTVIGDGQTVLDLSADDADVTIYGTTAGGGFGKVIAAGGNLSPVTDSYFDFAVSGGGNVYVFFGGRSSLVPFPPAGSAIQGLDSEAAVILPGAPGEDFGASVAGLADMNRDGHDDLLVGAPGVDAAYIYLGPLTFGQAPSFSIYGPAGAGFGKSAASVNDVNKDGYADALVGAPDLGQAFFWF